jgi:hypothetical protein
MADQKDQPRPNQLNIEISEEVADGIYSNLAIITHSNSEFVLDFVRVMPGVPKAKVRARVLLTPQHAKRLMRALTDNIQKFEIGGLFSFVLLIQAYPGSRFVHNRNPFKRSTTLSSAQTSFKRRSTWRS